MKKTRKRKKGGVESPCIKNCSLDRNNICPGCHRSLDEIIAWSDADDNTKRKIIEAARLRRAERKKSA